MRLTRVDFRAMASPCEAQIRCDDDDAEARAALDAARDEVLRIEAKYSRYRDDSVVSAINRSAGGAAIALDEETAALVDFAARAHEESGGLFDITSGVLRRAWSFQPGAAPPSRAAIDALLPLIGWSHVEWSRPMLRLPIAGMELDFGGFGKEYAADRAAAAIAARGHAHALVNLGGDVRVLGSWRIGIQHPRQLDGVIATIELDDAAIATSGDYERYFEHDGTRYSHLLDPRTGWPVETARSASVIAPLCVVAGALATTALLRGDLEGPAWLDAQGARYLWVDRDGTMSQTRSA